MDSRWSPSQPSPLFLSPSPPRPCHCCPHSYPSPSAVPIPNCPRDFHTHPHLRECTRVTLSILWIRNLWKETVFVLTSYLVFIVSNKQILPFKCISVLHLVSRGRLSNVDIRLPWHSWHYRHQSCGITANCSHPHCTIITFIPILVVTPWTLPQVYCSIPAIIITVQFSILTQCG